jgi:hypothetical protein
LSPPIPNAKFTVRTISDLLNVDPNVVSHVTVLGYLRPGDGGGGDFSWIISTGILPPEDKGLIFYTKLPNSHGYWSRVFAGDINIRWFGAQGDWESRCPERGTDDYDAILRAAATLTRLGTGTLYFPPGTYRIGAFVNESKFGGNTVKDIVFQNCNGLTIKGYGAKIDVNGSFYRTTNDIHAVVPFVFLGCKNVTLEGLELDGNVNDTDRVSGVTQGGNGIIFGGGSSDYTLKDLYVHHFANDGIYLGLSAQKTYPNASQGMPDKNAVLLNVQCRSNARNGVSIISLDTGKFENCEFSESGHDTGSYGFDSPGAGVDIEPQFGIYSGNLTFTDCRLVNNAGSGIDISSGPVSFQRCLFWGTEGRSFIIGSNIVLVSDHPRVYAINKAAKIQGVSFEDCSIYGQCLCGFADPQSMPTFLRCHFEDKEYPPTGKVFRTDPPYGACIVTNLGNIKLQNCLVIANRTRALQLSLPVTIASSTAVYEHFVSDSTAIHRFSGLPPHVAASPYGHQSQMYGIVLSNTRFMEEILPPCPQLSPPPNKNSCWFIDAPLKPPANSPNYVDGPFIRWGKPDATTPQVIP